VGSTQETVIRLNRPLGEHGKALHEEEVQHVKVREAKEFFLWLTDRRKTAGKLSGFP